jgi:transcriptional regulator with XRE-family HTH domain
MSVIGDNLKKRRKELHMTLEDISRKTGLPKSTVQRWESGTVTNMGMDNLRKVADALDTTVSALQSPGDRNARYFNPQPYTESELFSDFILRTGFHPVHIGQDLYFADPEGLFYTPEDAALKQEVIGEMMHYFRFLMSEHSISGREYNRRDYAFTERNSGHPAGHREEE